MKKAIMLISVVGTLLFMAIMGSALGEYIEIPQDIPDKGTWSTSGFLPRQGNETEPQPINLYFMGGDGGELRVEMPEGNATTDVPCPGHPTPKILGYRIGEWTSPEINSPITIATQISCRLWVKSAEGANGVHFNVQFVVNGQTQLEVWTESKSVPATPIEIRGEDSASGPIQLQAGDTIGARLYYFSDSKYLFGPGADSTLVVGGTDYDTHVTITTSPITISVQEPVIGTDFVTFSANFNDAFASSTLNANLIVDGRVDVETVSGPRFAPSDNGSMVSWNWDHKTDKGRSGEYIITISLSYSEENEFSSMGTYVMEFSETDDDGGAGGLGWLIPLIIVVVIIAVIVVVVKVIMGRRSAKSTA